MARRAAQTFDAVLEKAGPHMLGWTVVRVPFVPAKVWPAMVRLRVKGTLNGEPFRTSLFPLPVEDRHASAGESHLVLLVNNALQHATGVRLGSLARVVLEPDLDPRPAELPDELAALLDEVDGLRSFYDSMSESHRREIGKWIAAVKSGDARLNRCRQMAERLLQTMEAERELPPLIETAFRRRPKARAGWARLTPTQRRNELLSVFYYQTPEARDRRLEKLCRTAESKAEP